MPYSKSAVDNKLEEWFKNDLTRANLHAITIAGRIRGLTSAHIELQFPISVLAGRNGSGKSTLLAVAACAFHNTADSFPYKNRKRSYYTFADFFVASPDDPPQEHILIRYKIAHNNWRGEPPGFQIQQREKRLAGKWNDYATRVHRTVVFLGIERIVPHAEKGPSRSYSRRFRRAHARGWELAALNALSYVLGRNYDSLHFSIHSVHRLPVVLHGDVRYSGFNMGAGENALIELFAVMYSVNEGSLIVVDEVELGLHLEAQRRLTEKLKDICLERKLQLICTTHSSEVFERVPPSARIFVEQIDGKTEIRAGVSPSYAFSKLAAKTGSELDVFVEDVVARAILRIVIPESFRSRVHMQAIGSASVLARQLAAARLRASTRPQRTLAVFDGDQRSRHSVNRDHFVRMTELPTDGLAPWFDEHVVYLPGETWPERWLLNCSDSNLVEIAAELNCAVPRLREAILYGHQAGKHREFHAIAETLSTDEDSVLNAFARSAMRNQREQFAPIVDKLAAVLA